MPKRTHWLEIDLYGSELVALAKAVGKELPASKKKAVDIVTNDAEELWDKMQKFIRQAALEKARGK